MLRVSCTKNKKMILNKNNMLASDYETWNECKIDLVTGFNRILTGVYLLYWWSYGGLKMLERKWCDLKSAKFQSTHMYFKGTKYEGHILHIIKYTKVFVQNKSSESEGVRLEALDDPSIMVDKRWNFIVKLNLWMKKQKSNHRTWTLSLITYHHLNCIQNMHFQVINMWIFWVTKVLFWQAILRKVKDLRENGTHF